ncbi:MAG: hypothetical protein Q7S74_00200 [Nanoarchaeota archaeon]|nr:hypothetical protein [Nanoarchaeota archaeon]
MSKRGQLAIWVIIALVLAASILIFFMLRRGPNLFRTPEPGIIDAQTFIEQCTEKNTQEALNIMLPQGGFVSPRNTKRYNNTNVEYLCENIGSYDPCINQHPMLLNEMKKEIGDYLYGNIADCFFDLQKEAEKRQGNISYGSILINVSLVPNKVKVKIIRSTTVSTKQETRTYDEFDVDVMSPAYDLAIVATEIAAQEAKYCYFENVGYHLLYPRFSITRYSFPESTKIYTIRDTKTGKYMMVATRSCAIPSGL